MKINLFSKLIFPNDPENRELLEDVISELFTSTDKQKIKSYSRLLPDEITLGDRVFHLGYKLLENPSSGNVAKIMTVISETTDKRDLENRIEKERNFLRMVVKAVTDYNEFIGEITDFKNYFSQNIYELLESCRSTPDCLTEIFRTVHTFKGIFGQLEMINVVQKIHIIEEELLEMQKIIDKIDKDQISEFFKKIDVNRIFDTDLRKLKVVLGEDFISREGLLYIEPAQIAEIENDVISLLSKNEIKVILPKLNNIRFKSIKELLKSYSEHVKSLSEKLSKPIAPMKIEGDNISLDPQIYEEFTRSLVHVFRNMIDHGIEDSDERFELEKNPSGKIECKVKAHSKNFTITISDDGRGIDVDKVANKALERGIFTIREITKFSVAEKLNIIFHDEISTRDQASEISGRGIGLAAVKAAIEKLGGNVKVTTKLHKGTEFIFTLPYDNTFHIPEISENEIMETISDKMKSIFKIDYNLDCEIQNVEKRDSKSLSELNKYTSLIYLNGIVQGYFLMSFDRKIAEYFTQQLLPKDTYGKDPDKYFYSITGEVSNIVIGNAIQSFKNISDMVNITPPIIFRGDEPGIINHNSQILSFNINNDAGNLKTFLMLY